MFIGLAPGVLVDHVDVLDLGNDGLHGGSASLQLKRKFQLFTSDHHTFEPILKNQHTCYFLTFDHHTFAVYSDKSISELICLASTEKQINFLHPTIRLLSLF